MAAPLHELLSILSVRIPRQCTIAHHTEPLKEARHCSKLRSLQVEILVTPKTLEIAKMMVESTVGQVQVHP